MRLVEGHVVIDLSEEVDPAVAQGAIDVGEPVQWGRLSSGLTLFTNETLTAGTHTLRVGTGLTDLGGNALPKAFELTFQVPEVNQNLELFKEPDPQVVDRSSVGNRVGFQGRPRDPETGFVYFRNRYYDPELGRFITTDPLGYTDGANLYQYGLNNPVDSGDPLGLCVGDLPCPRWLRSAAGYTVGLAESAGGLAWYLGTLPYQQEKLAVQQIHQDLRDARRLAHALSEGGLRATAAENDAILAERRRIALERLSSLVPGVNTYREGSRVRETYEREGAFAGGRQLGRTFFSLELGATVVYGAARLSGVQRGLLLDELEKAGIKHSPEGIVRIARDTADRVIFLEKGNARAGLEHIVAQYAEDFARVGIREAEIPDLVIDATTKGQIVGSQGTQGGRAIYEVTFKGQTRRVAVTVSDNGFIVGANPVGH